jgi:hypothetical protein
MLAVQLEQTTWPSWLLRHKILREISQ